MRRLATRPARAIAQQGESGPGRAPETTNIVRGAGTPSSRRWSEAAWHALFHPPAGESATARQARRQRQQRTLDQLQPLLGARPAADDAVSGWFTPAIAQRLGAAGWTTLAKLQAGIAES